MNRLVLVPLMLLALGSAAIGPCDHEPLGSADKPDGGTDASMPADGGPALCTPDKCAGKPIILIGCVYGEPTHTCVQESPGTCDWRVDCPPAPKCAQSDCGMPPPVPLVCPNGGTRAISCDRNPTGQCAWTISPCPETPACMTADCGPIPPVAPCPGNPAGRTTTCERDAATGRCGWMVSPCDTPDAGVRDAGATCSDENPARACKGPGKCIPSGCACDVMHGAWACTADCGGGVDCGGADGGSGGACTPAECGPTDLVARVCANGTIATRVCERAASGRCTWIDRCPNTGDCTGEECGPGPVPTAVVPCRGGGNQFSYCARDGSTGRCGWKTACTCDGNQCPPGPPVACPPGSGKASPYFCGRNADGSGTCGLIQSACVDSPCPPQAPCQTTCPFGYRASSNGCPTCQCLTACNANISEPACKLAASCAWITAGCAAPSGTPNGGCFDGKGVRCTSSTDCSGGKQCQKVWTNPCPASSDPASLTCNACGGETTACR